MKLTKKELEILDYLIVNRGKEILERWQYFRLERAYERLTKLGLITVAYRYRGGQFIVKLTSNVK